MEYLRFKKRFNIMIITLYTLVTQGTPNSLYFLIN